MESVSILNLIELLKSQLALYTEVRDLLALEKRAVTDWKPEETLKFTRKKESLARKERILEEARKTLTDRIKKEYGLSCGTISAIIEACPEDPVKESLARLKESLIHIAASINKETTALKILYSTNLKLINELYVKMGYPPAEKYGMGKRPSYQGSSIKALG